MSIVDLWLSGCLPIKSGLYRADGVARAVRIGSGQPSDLELLDSFSLDAVLAADPEYVSRVDITLECELRDGSGYLVCGEGSYGSEGFFGQLDVDRRLVWVVYLEDSNPFIDVVVESTSAIFTSSAGLIVRVYLDGDPFHS
ncbi:hypothetical protein OG792_31400 [Micromonospora sp. NBC_01699]|uniref:hypothetical protein n=1 Tax=Micromonospora sp. NBC_01699 TaxID=2975984 RepID=UPI002E2D33CD|nr:hypothetical protein [Micromonospora sp. NBC_01699]